VDAAAGARPCSEIEANSFFHPGGHLQAQNYARDAHYPATFGLFPLKTMAQCNSIVFFPDDPGQPPQFNDCPRQAQTTRRTVHSVMRLCSTCAKVWDEQDARILPSRSNRTAHHRAPIPAAEQVLALVSRTEILLPTSHAESDCEALAAPSCARDSA